MKKIITIVTLGFLFSLAYSQQDSLLRTKGGKVILPQKGDYAVGFSVNSIFSYVGNMLSSSGTNQLNLNLLNGNTLYGKYFLSSKSAIRVKLWISQSTKHNENNVVDDNDNTKNVTDKLDYSFINFGITIGYEKRKGSGRLQVSYGAELNFSLSNYDYKYAYGNAFSNLDTDPTSTSDFINSYSYQTTNRPIEVEQNNGIGIGIRAFTGIEYFIFPKISIGGEIGLGYMNNFYGKHKNSIENWDYSSNSVKISNDETKNSSSNINTDILNGQIFLMFHFK